MTGRALMIGPTLDSRGGMASFAETVLKSWSTYRTHDISLAYYPTVSSGSKARKMAHGALSYIGFAKALDSVDVVHVNFSLGASLPRKRLFARKARELGKRVVLQSHTSALERSILSRDRRTIENVLSFLELADSIIVLTDYWKRMLVSIGVKPSVIHVVPNGVEIPGESGLADRHNRPRGDKLRILYLGRLEPEKGLDVLFDAFSAVEDDTKKYQLVIAGSGETSYVSHLVERARILSNEVVFVGWVEGEEKADLIRSSDVFVLPSYREVLPMSLLESMAAGVSPIATKCGAVPEVVSDGCNGLLCEVGDAASLSSSIMRMCSDTIFREQCAMRARETVAERYSVKSMVEKICELYQEVLDRG